MRPWELVEHESIKRNTLYTLGIFTDQLILVCSPNLHSCSTLCLLLLQHLFCPFAHTSLSTCLCVCDFDICVELWSLLTRLPRCGVCDFWWVCDCVSWVQLRLCYVWICHMSTNLIGLLQCMDLSYVDQSDWFIAMYGSVICRPIWLVYCNQLTFLYELFRSLVREEKM